MAVSSVHSPGYPGTHYVDQAGLQLTSASNLYTTPALANVLMHAYTHIHMQSNRNTGRQQQMKLCCL